MAGPDRGAGQRPAIQAGRIAGRPAADRARRHLAWSLGAAALAAVLVAFLLETLERSGREGRDRSSLSARADGFRGLFEVARKLGYQVERHRLSYGQLPPPPDSVLLVLDPLPEMELLQRGSAVLDRSQVRSLKEWMERGGRVVASLPGRDLIQALGIRVESRRNDPKWIELGRGDVIALLLDPPPATRWAPAGGPLTGHGDLAGFRGAWPPPPPEAAVLAATYLRRPGERWSSFDGLFGGSAEVDSEKGTSQVGEQALELVVFTEGARQGFTEACRLGDDPLVLKKEQGDGALWLVATSYPFANLALARGGTALFAAALIDAATEGGRRRLVFDEFCHGLWPQRGLFGWITGTSLIYPVLALAAVLAALAWRGAVRLGPPAAAAELPRRAKEEFVISLADIALRARRHRAAARWILDAHRTRLAAAGGAAGGDATGTEPPEIAALAARLEARRQFSEADLLRFTREVEELARKLEKKPTEDTGKHVARH